MAALDASARTQPSAVVPDSSVAAKWFLNDEEHIQEARALLAAFMAGSLGFVIPDCFYYEFSGLVMRAERRGRLTSDEADGIVATVANMPLVGVLSGPFIARALARARAFEGSPYDAIYLLLAEDRDIPFVTADGNLYKKVGHLEHVHLLANVAEELSITLSPS